MYLQEKDFLNVAIIAVWYLKKNNNNFLIPSNIQILFRYLRLSPDVFLIADLFELELIVSILKIEIPYDPAIPVLGIYLKRTKTLTQKDICTPMFIAH